jgi:PAS domain S-box-containing protein
VTDVRGSVILELVGSHNREATILLVEDERIVALAEQQILESEGYTVLPVESGEEAVHTARVRQQIDLILMDIDLGTGIDGTEAAERILEMRSLPIVFLTSHQEKSIVERTRDLTSYGYVIKTSGEFVLLESIRMALALFHAHTASRQSASHLRAMFDAVADPVFVIDSGLTIVLANTSAAAIADGDRSSVEGKRFQELYPEYAEEVHLIILACIQEQETLQYTIEVNLANQGDRRYNCRCMPVEIVGHTEKCVQFALSEVADEVESEGSAPIDSLLPAITRNAPGFLFRFVRSVTGKFSFNYVSEAIERYFGYKAKTVIEQPATLLRGIPADEYQRLRRILHESTLTGKSISETHRFESASGEQMSVKVNASTECHPDGSVVWTGICTDVTEEARALEKLRENEAKYRELAERYRFLTETTNEIVCLHDPDGTIHYVSPSVRPMLGYDPGELMGRQPQEFIHPNDMKSTVSPALELAQLGENVRSVVYRLRRRDGLYVWLDSSSESVVDADGEITSLITKSRDVSERRATEEQLRKALLEHEYLIREMNHRVKNNLAMVKSLLDLKQLASDPPVDLSDVSNRIEAIRLLHDLMHRTESTKQIDMRRYLSAIVDVALEALGQDDVVRNLRIDPVFVPADQALPVALIVNEQVTNAVKHGFPYVEKKEVSVRFEERNDNFLLETANSGPPLPPARTDTPSAGMGLRLIGALVDQLSGTLTVVRNPSPRFSVLFPRAINNE